MLKDFLYWKFKYPMLVLRSRIYRKVIAYLINKAMSENTERNKIITCDFILEENTSPQDEFELFKYIYNKKDSGFEPYYIINEHSSAYPEIKAEYGDNIIPYSTENHVKFSWQLKNLFKTTKFICGGFQVMHALNFGITDAVKKSPYVYSFFTQHGVNFFKNNFITQATYSQFLFDKIMISNEFEKELFISKGCYEEENLVPNGLFRWDLLSADNAKSEKSIFIYFTHRRYLRHISDITESVYVQTITGLLKDPRFTKLVKDYGYTVKVALHHTVLSVCGSDVLDGIHILEDAEIAAAKRDSAILITDYSSMCFEMWFQHKPVIFLNVPDREDCLRYKHKTDLPTPYKDKEDYIFNVVDTVDECIDMLDGYFKTDFEFTESDKEKRDRFFYYNSGFCERFYNYLAATKNDTKTMYQMQLNNYIRFARYPDIYTEGIEYPDNVGRWIVSKKAKIGFHIPHTDKDLAIKLRGGPYLRYKQYEVHLKFYVNGHYVRSAKLFTRKNRGFLLQVPNSWFADKDYIEITICASNVYRRKELKIKGNDGRYLSLKLISMDIIELEPDIPANEQIKSIEEQRRLVALEEKRLRRIQYLEEMIILNPELEEEYRAEIEQINELRAQEMADSSQDDNDEEIYEESDVDSQEKTEEEFHKKKSANGLFDEEN
ncbi:MAG: hypothetical protein E7497_00190 [Ruminococcus sp.]|nr:hypothetical protein [Ruminococcus sp.]